MLTNNTHNSMPKNKKLHHEEAAGSRRSLDDFHDAILKHILSFLSTKFAARTSVLSKRWEFMWTSLPTLDFDEFHDFQSGSPNVAEREPFMNFVERALILHKSCIRKFSLRCNMKDDFSRIKRWISAVSRNVQEFEIKLFPGNDKFVFPICLFNCATLEVLKLELYCGIQLPSQISLPCLKILTLHSLWIEDSHPINLLFAGPALEQLFIYNCKWRGECDIIISAPKLWKLSIDEPIEMADRLVTISAPQLQTLVYKGSFFKEYRFPHPPSITNATLEIRDWMGTSEINKVHFDKVLRSLQSVESLALSPAFALALSHSTVPKFRKLINLKIFGFSDKTELPCKELERLVNKCPCLESLEIRDWMGTSEINKVYFDKVLRSLQSVESLALSPAFALALSHSTVPKFRKLINLEVGFSDNTALTCKDLERLVNKCPYLESLKLLQHFSFKATYKFDDVSNLKFQYLPSTLKEFMIGNFSGEIEGIYFIRILLSKLTSLETMKIVFRRHPKDAKREEIKSILSALQRGSKSCKLIIG